MQKAMKEVIAFSDVKREWRERRDQRPFAEMIQEVERRVSEWTEDIFMSYDDWLEGQTKSDASTPAPKSAESVS
jgi:hypothetical protein